MAAVTVRAFAVADVPELLELMRGLARFEGYLDRFCVTEATLIEHGLGAQPRFGAFVAELAGAQDWRLAGMAVTYVIPWTFDLRPTLVMKELFVRDEARGQQVGAALLRAVAARAAEIDAPRVIWTVLSENRRAQAFYRSHGAEHDSDWQNWHLDEAAIRRVSALR